MYNYLGVVAYRQTCLTHLVHLVRLLLIRMALETVIVFASITGRTLVMPPSQHMYLLGEKSGKELA